MTLKAGAYCMNCGCWKNESWAAYALGYQRNSAPPFDRACEEDSMRSTPFVVALVACTLLGLTPIASAQSAPRLTIHNVTLQEGTGLLTITGTDFGPTPVVTVNGQPVAVLLGATETQLAVLAPAALLTTPGSYRLTVVDPVRQIGESFVVASHAATLALSSTALSAPSAPATGIAPAAAGSPVRGPVVAATPRSLDGPAPLIIEDSGFPHRTAIGYLALNSNTTGTENTASGNRALAANTTGSYNTANGAFALNFNTVGERNTAIGMDALGLNITGNYNTASGFEALLYNQTGESNTASGSRALFSNVSGAFNTASGFGALYSSDAVGNTANGYQALTSNKTGSVNTASGLQALRSNTTGDANTASGANALYATTTGSRNAALGVNAGSNATTGSFNLFLGADVTGTAADANTIRIGLPYNGANGVGQKQTFIAGIYLTALTGTAWPVYVDANGQLGTLAGGGTIMPPPKLPQQVLELQQQLRDQRVTNADLRARLTRLEALVTTMGRK
jgi:hypothetical protein